MFSNRFGLEKEKPSLNKILLLVAAGILCLIILITIIGFITRRAVPAYGLRRADPAQPQTITAGSAEDPSSDTAFTSLGQLRTVTKPAKKNSSGVIVIISPWLTYQKGDKAFYEEIDRKDRSIRSIITSYFSRYTERELLTRGELAVKADLLNEINSSLVLGKVQAIYFNEYMFLE